MENKTGKYFKYAIGEILLVVIGILIALQLNNLNDNRKNSKLGYQFLTEMKSELTGDLFTLGDHIKKLKNNIENQEAAMNTKDIHKLSLDSLYMIITPVNLNFRTSELTYLKMNNLGITSLSNNENLNSKILNYYNKNVEFLKGALSHVFDDLMKYEKFYLYEQDKIDLISINNFVASREFSSLNTLSKDEAEKKLKSNIIEFIQSIKGRNLVLYDLGGKRFSLGVLNNIQAKTTNLLKAIYEELKIHHPEIQALPILPAEMVYKEITLSQDILKNYIGTYKGESFDLIVLLENMRIYVEFPDGKKV
ncbi:hypothetical protein K8354_08700 [Polaribacter litorisediminis]|uniref:DUF6090 family protein n=1 Tax=Polaribacter litorisediminis TaxID=1908341 RepID=UPI001CBD5E39|nr:DUF6090 family protein [Polaribacter litorisediminis]UAM99860.1 hypothetical protein K8354_08700 [Polaribacter litorisediminis]